MPRMLSRALTGGAVALVLTVTGGPLAAAAEPSPPPSSDGTSVWLLPGVDVGALLGPLAQLPGTALQPVATALDALGGVGALGAIGGLGN